MIILYLYLVSHTPVAKLALSYIEKLVRARSMESHG